MRVTWDPFRLLLISLAGWMNQQQQDVIEYLQGANRVLREQLASKPLRLQDDQRRGFAVPCSLATLATRSQVNPPFESGALRGFEPMTLVQDHRVGPTFLLGKPLPAMLAGELVSLADSPVVDFVAARASGFNRVKYRRESHPLKTGGLRGASRGREPGCKSDSDPY